MPVQTFTDFKSFPPSVVYLFSGLESIITFQLGLHKKPKTKTHEIEDRRIVLICKEYGYKDTDVAHCLPCLIFRYLLQLRKLDQILKQIKSVFPDNGAEH